MFSSRLLQLASPSGIIACNPTSPTPEGLVMHDLSRRSFLHAGTTASLCAVTAARAAGSGDRLSVAILGSGGRGRGILNTCLRVAKEHHTDVTAVCDIWSRNRELAAALVKKSTGREPRLFSSLDDLLAARDIDAVLVATPDHQHARQLIALLEGKKHVYLEKPFANRLDEANAAIDAASKSDRVVTIGTQRRSDPRYMTATELMKKDTIGPVVQVELIQNAYSPYRWRNATLVKSLREKDTDWKAFLAGRRMRTFDPHQYVEFRLYRDFSTGIIDQWMTHMVDTIHLLSGATYPRSVVAHGGCYAWKDGRENGDTVHVLLDYPQGFLAKYSCTLANGAGASCRVMGRHGTLEFENTWRISSDGIKGSKVATREITPKEGVKGDMDTIHMRNWLACARSGERKTNCTAEHGYQHAIACIMADQALHSGKRLLFDEKTKAIREG
jgi:predicted dehydrogenase